MCAPPSTLLFEIVGNQRGDTEDKYYKYGPTLESFIQQMAPTHSKPIPEPRPPGARKRVLAASLASTDNVDVAAVKRRKLEAIAAERQQRQPSVQDADADDEDQDDSLTSNTSLRPRNASCILEAADGSDDVEVEVAMGAWGGDSDEEELPGLEDVDASDEEDEEDEEGEVGETDGEELGKYPVDHCRKLRLTVTILFRASDCGVDLTSLRVLSACP
jgi:hypothetical protein